MDYQHIGSQIRICRNQVGLTQEQLAEEANLSATYISHMERGTKKASLEALIQVAEALDVTLDRLLTGNLNNDLNAYLPEVQELLENSTVSERKFLYEIVKAIRESLRNNNLIM